MWFTLSIIQFPVFWHYVQYVDEVQAVQGLVHGIQLKPLV